MELTALELSELLEAEETDEDMLLSEEKADELLLDTGVSLPPPPPPHPAIIAAMKTSVTRYCFARYISTSFFQSVKLNSLYPRENFEWLKGITVIVRNPLLYIVKSHRYRMNIGIDAIAKRAIQPEVRKGPGRRGLT